MRFQVVCKTESGQVVSHYYTVPSLYEILEHYSGHTVDEGFDVPTIVSVRRCTLNEIISDCLRELSTDTRAMYLAALVRFLPQGSVQSTLLEALSIKVDKDKQLATLMAIPEVLLRNYFDKYQSKLLYASGLARKSR